MASLLLRGAFEGALYLASGPGEPTRWTADRRAASRLTLAEADVLQRAIVAEEGRAVALVPETVEQRERAEREVEAW